MFQCQDNSCLTSLLPASIEISILLLWIATVLCGVIVLVVNITYIIYVIMHSIFVFICSVIDSLTFSSSDRPATFARNLKVDTKKLGKLMKTKSSEISDSYLRKELPPLHLPEMVYYEDGSRIFHAIADILEDTITSPLLPSVELDDARCTVCDADLNGKITRPISGARYCKVCASNYVLLPFKVNWTEKQQRKHARMSFILTSFYLNEYSQDGVDV